MTADRPEVETLRRPPKPGQFCDRHWSWLCQSGKGKCGPSFWRRWGGAR